MNRDAFLRQAAPALDEILANIAQQSPVALDQLPADQAALISIDLNNGFCRQGALASSRVGAVVPEAVRIHRYFRNRNLPIVLLSDSHKPGSPEFVENGGAYPVHCAAGTLESEPVAELAEIGGYRLVPKESTNGYLEPEFQAWLRQNPERRLFVVIGDCTDICVLQFALTLKADFTRRNEAVRVIVIADAVETYDAPWHNGDLTHVMALYLMQQGGIEIAPRAI